MDKIDIMNLSVIGKRKNQGEVMKGNKVKEVRLAYKEEGKTR